MLSGDIPSVGLFCSTYLEPEMLHIHRQIVGLKSFRPVVVAQKVKGTWSGPEPRVVPRSSVRFIGRAWEQATGHPWQISSSEVRAISKHLTAERCQLLHIFFGSSAIHLLPLLRRSRIPVLVSFHGSDVTGGMAGEGYRRARQELFSRAALVPCRSVDLAQKVIGLGCPPEKTRILRTVLPPIDFLARQAPVNGAWRIIQAARLVPKKGIGTALEAFARFHQRFPLSRYIIAGSGPDKERLQSLAANLGVADAVEFLGFLSSEQLFAEFQKSHIYLHPSELAAGDVEGIPNALLEAMAAGLPPVSTRHGGIPEVIVDGESGLLAPERDPEALAEAMLRLAEKADLYSSIGKSASERAKSLFSPEQQAASVTQIYQEALIGGNPAS